MKITKIDTGKTFPERAVLWFSKDEVVFLEPSEEELAKMIVEDYELHKLVQRNP